MINHGNRSIEATFESSRFKKIELANIETLCDENVLILIGNGFDIMHGAKSGYSDFRDSMDETDALRWALECSILGDNLWSDFEASLANIDAEGLLSTVDFWMDYFDVKDSDDSNFSAANFFAAQDAAVTPARIISDELHIKFRNWVNRLRTNCDERPLTSILSPRSQYINFNYTEFLESLYGIPSRRICYIHGDRGKKHQELILGHADDETSQTDHFEGKGHYGAYCGALLHLNDYFDSTTKQSHRIIKSQKPFFSSLGKITDILVIGHSMSAVDYSYFRAIISNNNSPKQLKWKISWHTTMDINRIEKFATSIELLHSQIEIFKL